MRCQQELLDLFYQPVMMSEKCMLLSPVTLIFFFFSKPGFLFFFYISSSTLIRPNHKLSTTICLQVPSLIPVLLYKLGRECNPNVVHAVLYCLPNLGTHRVRNHPLELAQKQAQVHRSKLHHQHAPYFQLLQLCIPLVLQNLSMLTGVPKMAAVAMRLLTALWKIQVGSAISTFCRRFIT